MTKILKVLILGLITSLALSFPMTASALPILITVQGTVERITDDAGIINNSGFNLGSEVCFTLEVDLSGSGVVVYNDGTNNAYIPYDPRKTVFYAEYISGDALMEKGGGSHNTKTDVAQYAYGTTNTDMAATDWFEGFLRLGSEDACLTIFDIYPSPNNWHVGGTFGLFSNTAYDSLGNSSYMAGGPLTITELSHAPVPEPSTIILLFCGMAGIAVYRRKLLTT